MCLDTELYNYTPTHTHTHLLCSVHVSLSIQPGTLKETQLFEYSLFLTIKQMWWVIPVNKL